MWREYNVIPYFDGEDDDAPGWKYLTPNGCRDFRVVAKASDNSVYTVQVFLTGPEHEEYIKHPSVTYLRDV